MSLNYVRKIPINDVSFYFMTKSGSTSYSFKVWLTDGRRAYKGELTEVDLNEFSEKLKRSREAYASLFRNAFSLDSPEMQFSYELSEETAGSAILSWKHILASDVKVMLGRILLENADPNSVMRDILHEACDQLHDSHSTIKCLEKEQSRIKSDCHKAVKMLDEFAKEKQESETQLYSMFVTILNRKKEKIRQLKQVKSQGSSADESHSAARKKIPSDSEDEQAISKQNKDLRSNKKDDSMDTDSPDEKQEERVIGRRRAKVPSQTVKSAATNKVVKKTDNFSTSTDEDTDDLLDDL